MKPRKNQSGFTLLEIIIVIIIVGVLASLALPRFFGTIEFSRSTEASQSIGVLRASLERCALPTDDATDCGTLADLDVEDPGNEAGSHFTYDIVIDSGPGRNYTITATRNSLDGGDGTSTVFLIVVNTGVGKGITRGGTGVFENIK